MLKKELYKNLCHIEIWPLIITKVFLIIAFLFTILFLIIGYTSDCFIIRDTLDSGYGTRNTLLIYTIVITADVLCIFFAGIGTIIVKGIVGKDSICRINESLKFENDVLIYGYQNLVGSTEKDRVEVTIPLSEVKINFDGKTKAIILNGTIRSMYYENYQNKKTKHDGSFKTGQFVLYDYFLPSLKNEILNKTKIKKKQEKKNDGM